MKKTIILSFALLIGVSALAQPKTDTTKKAATPKPVKRFTISATDDVAVNFKIKLKAYQVTDYIFVEQNGLQSVTSSTTISAARAQGYAINHQAVMDSLNNHLVKDWNSFYKAQEERFKADTASSKKNVKSTKTPKTN